MDLKEKLKEILKKNYGITSDAELLEELDDKSRSEKEMALWKKKILR